MYSLIVLLPIFGAFITGILLRNNVSPAKCGAVASFLVGFSAVLAWICFFTFEGETFFVSLFEWINTGNLVVQWGIWVDRLTIIMLVVVTTVSFLVHVYSIGYMHEDKCQPRFYAYLSLFTFAMLVLVTSGNFLQLFFGWEGVGLASYLLIGFWHHKDSANNAAIKAFVVNRIGDLGFILAICTIYWVFGSLDFHIVFADPYIMNTKTITFFGYNWDILTFICLLLFMGAMGKSAQLFLHTWLPDAMEGPTPVSALIHAATMVTAGIFLIARCSPLFELSITAQQFIIIIGATTAFFAATVALTQNDIKRVIAYSTCSQLGYMFVALGAGAYKAAIFHLFTHAFFKAQLFLGAGSVIHAMSGEQDMRKMGGLYKLIPLTWLSMLIGTLALTGFPFLSGYYSKDAIIELGFITDGHIGEYVFALILFSAFLTSFYSWRLFFMTFHGRIRAERSVFNKVHESPFSMIGPILLLGLGSIFSGILFKKYFIGDYRDSFWLDAIFIEPDNTVLNEIHNVPYWVPLVPSLMLFLGLSLAIYAYIINTNWVNNMATMHGSIYRFLLHKWYFDELYSKIIVKPYRCLGYILWKKGDQGLIDKFGPDGLASLATKISGFCARIQTGYIYHYAFAMVLGLTILLSLLVIGAF